VSLWATASFGERPSFQVYCRRRGTHKRRVDRCYWTTTRVLRPGISFATACLQFTCPSTPRGRRALLNVCSAVCSAPTSIHRVRKCLRSATAQASHTLPLLVCLVLRNDARAKGSQPGFKHSRSRSDISGRLAPAAQGCQGCATTSHRQQRCRPGLLRTGPGTAAACSLDALGVAPGWLHGCAARTACPSLLQTAMGHRLSKGALGARTGLERYVGNPEPRLGRHGLCLQRQPRDPTPAMQAQCDSREPGNRHLHLRSYLPIHLSIYHLYRSSPGIARSDAKAPNSWRGCD
jgi:hypothetical protein